MLTQEQMESIAKRRGDTLPTTTIMSPRAKALNDVWAEYDKQKNIISGKEKVEDKTIGQKILSGTGKVGEFLGLGSLGKGVGLALSRLSPEIRNIERKILEGTASDEELAFYQKQFETEAPTNKQILGSAVQTVATIGTVGLGGIKGANVGIRIAKAGLQSGGIGSMMGFGKGLEENKTFGGALKQGAITGAISGLLGAGFQGSTELLRTIGDKLPKRIMQSVLKQTKAENLAGKDVSEYAIRKAKVGTVDSLISGSQKEIDVLNNQIDNLLFKSSGRGVKVSGKVVFEGIANSINEKGGDITSAEVQKIVSDFAPQAKGLLKKDIWSVQEANSVRKLLDRTLGDRTFLSSQLPFNKDLVMEVSNFLRSKVQTYSAETSPLFGNLSKEIRFRDALLNRAASGVRNQLVSLADLVAAIGGSAAGIPGALGAVIAKKTATSPLALTAGAILINKMNNLSTKIAPHLEKLSPIAKTAILNAIKEFSDSLVQQNE